MTLRVYRIITQKRIPTGHRASMVALVTSRILKQLDSLYLIVARRLIVPPVTTALHIFAVRIHFSIDFYKPLFQYCNYENDN